MASGIYLIGTGITPTDLVDVQEFAAESSQQGLALDSIMLVDKNVKFPNIGDKYYDGGVLAAIRSNMCDYTLRKFDIEVLNLLMTAARKGTNGIFILDDKGSSHMAIRCYGLFVDDHEATSKILPIYEGL